MRCNLGVEYYTSKYFTYTTIVSPWLLDIDMKHHFEIKIGMDLTYAGEPQQINSNQICSSSNRSNMSPY